MSPMRRKGKYNKGDNNQNVAALLAQQKLERDIAEVNIKNEEY